VCARVRACARARACVCVCNRKLILRITLMLKSDWNIIFIIANFNVRIVYYISYYYTHYFISLAARFLLLYPGVFCRGTDIILISSRFQCYSWGAISLLRYARYMQTYVLFQYSILRNIVSKTSESLIRCVVNLAYSVLPTSHMP